MVENNIDDIQTAKQMNFAFPPRMSTPRNKSKLSTSVPGSEDEEFTTLVVHKERPPPLGPGIPSISGTYSLTTGESPDRGRGSGFRERSASRGLPNIEIPPPLPLDQNVDLGSVDSPIVPSSSVPEPSPQATLSSRPVMNRKRSQSSVTGLASRTALANQRDHNLAAPGDFQFPLPPNGGLSSPVVLPLRAHKKASPSHASVSSTSSLLSSTHQSTYSLDMSTSSLPPRRLPPVGSLPLPPVIHRAHSANATPVAADGTGSGTSRKPSLSRQASVAVMEHVQTLPPLVPPSKPFARATRHRSNSGSSRLSDGNISTQSLGLPGLKDVLKVCNSSISPRRC